MTLWVTAEELDDPTSDDAADAAVTASLILSALSGRRYSGTQTVTEEYDCSSHVQSRSMSYRRYVPFCGAHRLNRVKLRGTPVRAVYELVTAYDTDHARVIPPAEYQLLNREFIRPAYNASWRPCSRLQITYSYGAVVPAAGHRAALVLANELVKSRSCPDECSLPDRVTSISRQGVSFTVLDTQDFLQDGRTGIYEIDLFLKAVNPDHARKRARVFSPDVPRGVRVGGVVQVVEPDSGLVDGGAP